MSLVSTKVDSYSFSSKMKIILKTASMQGLRHENLLPPGHCEIAELILLQGRQMWYPMFIPKLAGISKYNRGHHLPICSCLLDYFWCISSSSQSTLCWQWAELQCKPDESEWSCLCARWPSIIGSSLGNTNNWPSLPSSRAPPSSFLFHLHTLSLARVQLFLYYVARKSFLELNFDHIDSCSKSCWTPELSKWSNPVQSTLLGVLIWPYPPFQPFFPPSSPRILCKIKSGLLSNFPNMSLIPSSLHK
jgi:hypothetical protein